MSVSDAIASEETSRVLDLGLNKIFTILSNPRRRILVELAQEDGLGAEHQIHDLSTTVIATEMDVDECDLEWRDKKRGYTSLHQTHLPSMEKAGVLSYDTARKVVRFDHGILQLGKILDAVKTSREVSA